METTNTGITIIESANGTTFTYPLADDTVFVAMVVWDNQKIELNIADAVNTDWGTPTYQGARIATWDECPEPARYEIQERAETVLREWAVEKADA